MLFHNPLQPLPGGKSTTIPHVKTDLKLLNPYCPRGTPIFAKKKFLLCFYAHGEKQKLPRIFRLVDPDQIGPIGERWGINGLKKSYVHQIGYVEDRKIIKSVHGADLTILYPS